MVLERPEGGYFTTEAPDRTYKTERGVRQAERMFQRPELWHGWTREGREQADQAEQEVNDIFAEVEQEIENLIGDIDYITDEMINDAEDDIFYSWYELPSSVKDKIHRSNSNTRCITRLLANGWTGVYLSDLIEDFGNSIVDELDEI